MTFPDAVADFNPTHVVPQEGMPAWEYPDATRPTVPLDPFLPVQLLSRSGDWGEVLCANGWSAWVDGRLLIAVPQPPPTVGGSPPARGEDPRPRLARSTQTVERYRRAVEELASGRIDAEAFRRSVRGLRAGIVLDGESVWLYDEATGRWLYGDGTHLSTYAVAAGPGASPDAETDALGVQLDVLPDGADEPPAGPVGHAPTQIVKDPGTK